MIKLKGILIIAGLILISFSTSYGQQLPLLSQYMINRFIINPALAGSDGYTSINITAREQWIGFKHAPKTHTISAHTRLLKQSFILRKRRVRKRYQSPSQGGRVGIGGYIFNDRTGIIDRTGFQLTYAYHIPFVTSQLSFGLSVNVFQFNLDKDNITLYDESDPFMLSYNNTMFIPDAGFGVYYTDLDYNIGFSVSQLLRSSLKIGGNSDYMILRHYYFTGSYKFDLRNDYIFQPSVLFKTSDQLRSFQADINVLIYNQAFWGGITYRTSNSIIFIAGLKVDQYYFGYAVDLELNKIQNHNFGSHEIVAGIKFGGTPRRYPWLNRK